MWGGRARWKKTYDVQSAHDILDGKEVDSDVCCRQEDRPRAAEDEEGHACFLGCGPPFVLLLEVDEGIYREAHLGDGEGEDDTEEEGNLPGHAPGAVARLLAIGILAF